MMYGIILLRVFGLSFVVAVSAFDLFQGMSLLQACGLVLVLFSCRSTLRIIVFSRIHVRSL
jgi:hypothetical protein